MKQCPKCNKSHQKNGTFCSRSCANSRGPRTEEFKKSVRKLLKGKPLKPETIDKIKHTRSIGKVQTYCRICSAPTVNSRKTCSKNCFRQLISVHTRNNKNCGGARRSKRFDFQNIAGEIFVLDSSYELRFAKCLNERNIYWIRPDHLTYVDMNGKTRRYHPDFYVPELDVYFDPKNDYLRSMDDAKIKLVSEQNNITVIILSNDDIKMVEHIGVEPIWLSACKANPGTHAHTP